VGVSAFSDWPPEAKRLPEVGNAVNFSLEQIAALRPDLVLVWRDSMRAEDIERITGFGAVVFVASARTLDDVPRLLRAIGIATGHDAAPVASAYESKLEALRRANAGKPRMSAFLEIWNKPLTTIAGKHFMNEALAICGADNVFMDLPGVAPTVSWEEVYRRDPAVIVGIGSGTTEAEFRENWRVRSTLGAVKAGRLVYGDADRLQRPTARTPDGIARLCAALDDARESRPR
jgi:iron complex transport system substrate-binding protein